MSALQVAALKSREKAPKLGALANKVKRQREVKVIQQRARQDIPRLQENELNRLRDLGVALYWAEGTKVGNSVDFTNSDPEMMRIAMLWLRKVCKVPEEKFRIAIYYHNGQIENEIKEYWSKVTGVPLTQFTGSILKKEGTGQRKKVLYMGTCKVRVCDKDLLYRILAWINQLHLC